MKMYTNTEQTAKLIELGLYPKHIKKISDGGKMLLECSGYSIGELIEMLPSRIEEERYNSLLAIDSDNTKWWVMYLYMGKQKYTSKSAELIDALFDMVLILKEEGVI